MTAPTLQLPIPAPRETEGERFSVRFFERFDSEALVRIRKNLDRVMDDRARQYDLFGEPPQEAPKITTAQPFELEAHRELGLVLSPSQLNKWLDCQAAWYFKYFRGLPDVQNSNRALGLACHRALEVNFREKLSTGKDLDREEVLKLYDAAWSEEADRTQFDEDDQPEELALQGRILVQKFMVEAAPEIIPAAVEQKITGTIAGVKINCRVDLMDSNGRIIDYKFAKKKPTEVRPGYRRQLATYRQVVPGASGRATCYTAVRTKTPQLHEATYDVSMADIMHVEKMYADAQEGMRAGLYFPNRESMFCSRRSCPFWQACEEEFKGEVKP